MKSLLFDELLLVSQVERRARRIPLHPEVTVIRGENDTGKSSVIKSIYRTLGAEPKNIHPRWDGANVVSSLRFRVDGEPFRMIRHKSRFAIFDRDDILIQSFASVTKELAPYFADLFSFHLPLKSRNDDKQATPAFLFMPFYIDQDHGWQESLESFAKLRQFQGWRGDVVGFHTGLRPGEYYVARSRKRDVEEEIAGLQQQRDALNSVLERVLSRLGPIDFDLDIEAFSREIEELLRQCNTLLHEERKLRRRLTDAFNHKEGIEEQLTIVEAALRELRSDRDYATALPEDRVICPTCHAVYENGFAERFLTALDEDACLDLLSDLEEQKRDANNRWKDLKRTTSKASQAVTEIEHLLTSKREKVALQDVLRREGQKDVSRSLRGDIAELNTEIGALDERQGTFATEMKKYDDHKRQKEIKSSYVRDMQRLLQRLSVVNMPEKAYKRIDASIKETGSDLPRAILAYFFAITQTIHKNSSSTFCPLVIDSPRQQDQDDDNWRLMLECIADERPAGSQLILALVDDMKKDFGGSVVDLNDKCQVLQDDSYSEAMDELRPLIDASLGI